MKILVVHNLLWAHYKSVLFEEIQKQLPAPHQFHVLQIARNELSRKGMETSAAGYNYNYTLLFDDYIENVPKLREIVAVLRFFLKYNPDVVNVTGYSSNISTLPVIFLAWLLGKKIIMSNESTGSDERKGGIKEYLKRWAVKACSGYVVFGRSSEDYLVELGAKRDRVLVRNAAVVDNVAILNACKEAARQALFPEISTKKNFIFVGRMSPEKNVSLLVRAFQSLYDPAGEWGLILVGNGKEDENIMQLILQKPARIHKYNSVGWKVIPEFFSRAQCLVLPSSSEPWGLVVNEAMICGLAVIVTEACGCAGDLVNGNGYTVQANSLPDLQDALQNIMDTPDLSALKSRSEEIIKSFSVDRVAREYVQQVTALA